MNALWQTIITSSSIRQLGWTLIHSIWLGTLVGIALAAAQPILLRRRRSANARYLAACAALLLFFAATAAAYFLTASPAMPAAGSSAIQQKQTITAGPPAPTLQPIPQSPSPPFTTIAIAAAPPAPESFWSGFSRTLNPALPYLSTTWLAGVALIACWQISAALGVRKIKRTATPLTDPATTQLLDNLARLMNIRRPIPLRQSARVNVPTLIGYLAPAILLPAGLVTGLSPAQLRAILAHELAHVRRHDYLVNLLQTIAQTLFFFHPAAWYISARMRFEREACCDDLVIHRAGAQPADYAQSLLTVARRAISASRATDLPAHLALAAVASPSDLRRRVQRLLNHEPNPTRFAAAWPIPFLLITAVTTAALLHSRAPVSNAAEVPAAIATAPGDAPKNDDAAKKEKPATPNDLQIRLVAETDEKSEADEIPDPDHKDRPLRVLKPVLLDGRDILRAYRAIGQPSVGIDLTDAGGEKLKKITTDNINHRLAIIVNGQLLSAPTIRTTITKSLVITAGQKEFTPEKVQSIINIINNSRPTNPDKKPD